MYVFRRSLHQGMLINRNDSWKWQDLNQVSCIRDSLMDLSHLWCSARVVEELLVDIPDLGYFFFVVKAKESLDAMLSSILIRLATVQERSKILVDAYHSDKNKGNPSLSSLCEYVKEMLAVPRNVFLVIDALDEHPPPRDKLLRFLTNLSRDHHGQLRLLVTSRNESDIRHYMEGIGTVEVDLSKELEQKEDIRKYITHVLQSDQPF